MGINENTLHEWISKYGNKCTAGGKPLIERDWKQEVKQLKKEITRSSYYYWRKT